MNLPLAVAHAYTGKIFFYYLFHYHYEPPSLFFFFTYKSFFFFCFLDCEARISACCLTSHIAMGHKEGHTLAYNHRLLAATQRKIGSFVLLFSVVVVAWIIFLAAVHDKESRCQKRANEVKYVNFLEKTLPLDIIISSINEVFTNRSIVLKETSELNSSIQVDVMDTTSQLLSRNGFRLLRWPENSWIKWDLRTVGTELCSATFPISMEVLPNVDYEKAQYRITGLSLPHVGFLYNRTLQYMFSSQLRSNDRSRISTFVQLESVFPGFYSLSSSNENVAVQSSYSLKMLYGGLAYFGGIALDVEVRVGQWSRNSSNLFWFVELRTESLHSQTALMSIQNSLEQYFIGRKMICKGCITPEDVFLL